MLFRIDQATLHLNIHIDKIIMYYDDKFIDSELQYVFNIKMN